LIGEPSMPSSVDFSRGHAGCTNESTTIFPSRPVRTTMLPPGPESTTTLSASFAVSIGAAPNCARIFSTNGSGAGA